MNLPKQVTTDSIDFYDSKFLRQHIQSILDFYQPNIEDKTFGGFHHNFLDDGSVFEPGKKHLVSSCRMIFNYCKAYEINKDPAYLALVEKGLDYLESYHWDATRQGYNWLLEDNKPVDQTNHCYGLAFVILALATCHKHKIGKTKNLIYRAWNILNKRFWQEESEIYADEASPNWDTVSAYRGQNANMHCCEALILAYEATQDPEFLERAYQLAKTIAVTLADKGNGLVWEHYTEQLEIDWEYNKNDPKNLYRPLGYQPGHQTELSKLLLMLHVHRPENWMVEKAEFLFEQALSICWDNKYGGILYGHAPDNSICDSDKYFWVQAESFAAAALLYKQTKSDKYLQYYQMIWQYSWQHFVDHKHGAWFRILSKDNQKITNEKSSAGGKCDYHTMGACWLVLDNKITD